MQFPPDYHMHTPLCRHAVGEPIEYARRAVELGFTEIGFSDHSPMRQDDFDNWRMMNSQLDEYVAKVRLAQKEFPQLTIRLALEVDYLPGHEPWIRDLSQRHPWDYFIGSVHYVSDTWDIDNPAKLSEWKKRDPSKSGRRISNASPSPPSPACLISSAMRTYPKNSASARHRIVRRFTANFSPPPRVAVAPWN
jgi:histidinol phosphatase-like PHP family hydrolase